MLRMVWSRKWSMAIVATVGVLLGFLGWSTSFLIQSILDRGRNASFIHLVGAATALVAVVRAALSIVRRALQLGLVREIEREEAKRYLSHTMSLEMAHHDRYSASGFYDRLHGLENLRSALEDRFLGAMFDAVMVLVAAGFLLRYSGPLACLAAFGALVPAVIVLQVRQGIKESFRNTQEKNADLIQRCMDAFCGLRDLRMNGGEGWMASRIMGSYANAQNDRRRHLVKLAFIGNGTSLLSGLISITILLLGSRYLRSGSLSGGELMFVFTMSGSMLGPIENFVVSWIFFQDAAVALERAGEVLSLPAEATGGADLRLAPRGIITLDRVTFSYEGGGAPVLRNVSFEIARPSTVAIVGESGAGKSTLMALLAAIHRPTSGRILIDGEDLSAIPPRGYRRHLGVVFERPHLFSGTLEENIGIGSRDADSAAIRRALEAACLEDFIDSLPEGLRTRVGEGGVRISAGQAQRVAIARALFRCPAILLLDEATSNLDARTEAAIRTALVKQANERVTIFVTHRLASSVEADKIVVLERGEVVELGTFSELMKRRGSYYRLWVRQVPLAVTDSDEVSAGVSSLNSSDQAPE
jgi:ATP-binding cassette subfamily B protein